MDTLQVLLAALIILTFCLIILYAIDSYPKWAHLDYWKTHFIEGPDEIYARSAGGYDEAAALALQRSEDNPSPADHLRAATIIFRNIVGQEHRPQEVVTAHDVEISRHRQAMFGRAREHHMAALAGLTAPVIAQDEADRALRRYAAERPADAPPLGEIPGRPGAEAFIDAAVEFAFGGLETLIINDPLLADLLADERGLAAFEMLFIPDEEIGRLAEDRRFLTAQSRRATAAKVAEARGGGRGVQVDAFLDLSRRNTSDTQNSHDSSVNAAKRSIVARLRDEQGAVELLPSLVEISDELRRGSAEFSRDPRTAQARPVLTEKALAVVGRAHDGDRSSSAQATDGEVLRRVWARADAPRNANNKRLMRQAIYDALVDSWEPGIGGETIQCVDGRVSRILGALTLLDHDERNWEMRRLEQYKNEIYALAAETIRAAAEAAAQDADEATGAVGRAYLATSAAELAQIGPVCGAKEKAWIAEARGRVSRAIDEYIADLDARIPGAIPGYAIDGIKTEALMALAD